MTAPNPDQLMDQIGAQGKRVLHYARHRFLGTWLVLAILACLTSAALVVSFTTADRQNDAAKASSLSAKHKATDAQESTDQIVLYLQGKQGIPGVPGANGKDGAPGQPGSNPSELPQGPQGPQGPKGDQGSVGIAGVTGPPGTVGDQGPIGQSGFPGPTGAVGPIGAAGATGLTGAVGAPGEAGAAGTHGEKGAKGDTGATGPVGPTGPAGATGSQGPAGPTGPQGAAGPSQPINVATVSAQSPNDVVSPKDVIATCPTGSVLISGGYHWVPATPGLTAIADEPSGANGWHVTVARDTFPANSLWQLTVFAVCNATPPTPK